MLKIVNGRKSIKMLEKGEKYVKSKNCSIIVYFNKLFEICTKKAIPNNKNNVPKYTVTR